MTKQVFEQLIEEIRAESLDTLVQKNGRYNQGGDKLHNFYDGADIMGGSAGMILQTERISWRSVRMQSITFASSGVSATRKTHSGFLRTHTRRESDVPCESAKRLFASRIRWTLMLGTRAKNHR